MDLELYRLLRMGFWLKLRLVLINSGRGGDKRGHSKECG